MNTVILFAIVSLNTAIIVANTTFIISRKSQRKPKPKLQQHNELRTGNKIRT